jgi:hypothetical protein
MADAEEIHDEETTNDRDSSNGSGRRTVVRAAALAAASGATAFAAKKAFADRGSTSAATRKSAPDRQQEGDSLVSSMVTSAWDSARDSLVPMIEDAARQTGEYLAHNGPDLIRETVIPQFISGFERARKSSGGD